VTDEKAEPARVATVLPEELRAAMSGPAPGANKFLVKLGTPGVRISFLELNPELPGETFFRAAVTIHPQDALALRDVISQVLKDFERDLKRLQPQAADADE
jgi:hypothetical protein